MNVRFYHIKNLQSTKTRLWQDALAQRFITLRIYKVLKRAKAISNSSRSFITLRIYKVLKHYFAAG